MSLRQQLLIFVALTFVLPWAGLRFVGKVEELLRGELENTLTRSAGVLAQGVAGDDQFRLRSARPAGFSPPLYLHPLSRPPAFDGLRSDWRYSRDASDEAADLRALELGAGGRIWLGIHSSFLYLFVEVRDDEIVHQAVPGSAPHGDRIVLIFGSDPDNVRALLLAAPAASLLDAFGSARIVGQPSSGGDRFVPTGESYGLVSGTFRVVPAGARSGYTLEARLPLSLVEGTLGIGIIDSDQGGASASLSAHTWDDTGAPNLLISESPTLASAIRAFSGGTDRYRIFDANGWVLADTGALGRPAAAGEDAGSPIVERLLRRLLRRDDPEYDQALLGEPGRIGDPALLSALTGSRATAWFRRGDDASAIVTAAVPVDPDNPGRGAVLIEEASDPILTLRNRAMRELVTTTVLASLIATLALLAYASLLSFRIGRLARAAESALGPRGEIRTALPGTRAGDEIGALSRSFEDLLGRLRDYTDYLQSLKSKLSHELRTPLAIVATSVDNLEHETDTEAGRAYLGRLRQGAQRLESILQAMTAATRVEQAITQADPESFDLAAVVRSCVGSYADVYPHQTFELELPAAPVRLEGSAELIAQMLDKLVDNAAGFAAPDSAIEVRLLRTRREARIEIVNRGPLLPEAMRHQLFDSLVSLRDSQGEQPHLGLGLYIVTLVAEFHRGSVAAENLADGSGVRISVSLPCSDAGAA